LINDMAGGSPVRMGITIALRRLLPKPSPAYGSRFHRHEGVNIRAGFIMGPRGVATIMRERVISERREGDPRRLLTR